MRILVIVLCFGLSACALFQRNSRSGYQSYDEQMTVTATDIYEQKRINIEQEAREELGFLGRPLSDEERQSLEDRIRLKRKEANLATKRERKQYFQIRSSLRSDRERIGFLTLPTYEARERWAQQRGLYNQEETYSDEVANVIESNDIALGMSQKAVMESWGDPDMVEVAGDPVYGYERWKYNRYVSGNEGYQKELRVVYFEGGRVVGWERM